MIYGVMSVLQTDPHFYANHYTPVGDLVTVAVCVVMISLLVFSYVRRTTAYRVFLFIIPTLIVSALLDVTWNHLAAVLGSQPVVFILRCLFHASLFMVFFLYTLYITVLTRLERRRTIRLLAAAFAAVLAVVAADIVLSVRSLSAGESAVSGAGSSGHLAFMIGYVLFAGADVLLMSKIRRRLYKRVMWGFYASIGLAFVLLIVQRLLGSGSSFTVSTFLFPVLAMFYIIHSNPFDAELGALDGAAFTDVVRRHYEKKQPFLFVSLQLPAFSAEGKQMPDAVRSMVRRFSMDCFRGAMLFQIDNGHLLLLFRKSRNPDYEHRIEQMLKSFRSYHHLYQHSYRIVIGSSIDEISRKDGYISLIRSIHRTMPENTVHRVSPGDISAHDRSEYILRQLEDIHRTHDLNDRRVLVYCQPVYDVSAGRYDTAEALMRLDLKDLGLIFPDEFIYLAEDHGFIHTLTEIILHKTCEEIRRMTLNGYDVRRISVNVSMLELKNDSFCDDISGIISRSGIPGEKIAIELTESQSDSEFDVMKSKVTELKEKGITFYLDDFGTGYSNIERIIELPFDTIKFDRSLVTASGASRRSEKIVHNMASLFSELDYSVLYEGVESEKDETLCRDMDASYLQGFRYSRPIPISDLTKFMQKRKTG